MKAKKTLALIWICTIFLSLNLSIAAAAETPWQSKYGGMERTDLQWPFYSMGYEFTPGVNGKVTKLGGYFNGTMQMKLFNTSTGQILATVNATAANNWSYADIPPVDVVAGTTYTIAVLSGWPGTGVTMAFGLGYPDFPQTWGNITIERTVFGMGSSQPTFELWNQMWGQPDITFEPDTVGILNP